MAQQMTNSSGLSWVQKHIRISTKLHKKIKAEDKIQFFHHLTTLFAAGTPLLEALQIATRQTQSLRMQAVIGTIAEKVAAGTSLNQAAAEFPKVFDRQWIEVIKTGELSGQLAHVLAALNEYIKNSREMRGKIISAMIYPCIMCCIAVLAIVIMLWKVVPVFSAFFADFGSKLPGITQAVVNISEFLQKRGLMLFAGIGVAVFGIRSYLKTEKGKHVLDQIMLSVPMVGELVVYINMEKFATNIVLLLKSGLPLLETITSLQGVFHNNTVYREAMYKIQQRVSSGAGLASAMEESRLFTTMVLSMVKVGEESGELAKVLDQVSMYYRDKVKEIVERLTGCIEPIVILGMGVTVAVILTSIYLPMFQMASGVK
jgi:type II secretory pathway component PulF